ncbi:MAG: SdpI family protein [Cyclobacteriaceae bacterium]
MTELLEPLFPTSAVTGPIFILAGFLMQKFPPKKVNMLYGYRTESSMRSQERWDFAQKYSSREMIKLGVLLLLSSGLGLIVDVSKKVAVFVGLGFLILVAVVLIVRTEKAIKSRFPE